MKNAKVIEPFGPVLQSDFYSGPADLTLAAPCIRAGIGVSSASRCIVGGEPFQ